jgi:hypothetical protein
VKVGRAGPAGRATASERRPHDWQDRCSRQPAQKGALCETVCTTTREDGAGMIIRVILILGMEFLVLFVGLLDFWAGFVTEFGHTLPALFEQGIGIFDESDRSVFMS